ncbi:MAG: glycerol-3-phosphate 1-O-acyltransferase PlsY [Lachnospiraceae bacterium]|nr:glycerol-3-phosphate 1-O-acyltransferase PlsY [Lachnospiraceae bacterium]
MFRIICLAVGYCFGLLQFSIIYGKLKGFDIRKEGSGNAGTTNMLRSKGVSAGLLVFLGDLLKAIVAILLMYFICLGRVPDSDLYIVKIWTALGVILGHDYPFYLKFKGGKGIASTGGVVIAWNWTFIPVGICAFFIPYLITKYVSLGSLCMYSAFLLQTIIMGQAGLLGETTQAGLIEIYVILGAMTVLAFYQHRGNIKRLLEGNERKTYLSDKKNKVNKS